MAAPMPLLLCLHRRAAAGWLLAVVLLAGCAAPPQGLPRSLPFSLLPADALLLGEQHDADAHQQIHAEVVRRLAWRDLLAALALEMADEGRDTAALPREAQETAVREALQWNEEAWPWVRYRAAIMAAVRAGVPVVGANLPRNRMRLAMLESDLDTTLPPAALAAQREAIRAGHCDLLAASQLAPMARIQIARDQSMARTLQRMARPGKTVLLLTGSGHADRQLGVPRHLPPGFDVRAVHLLAGGPALASPAFDVVWTTPALPPKDHCTALRRQLGR